MMAAGAVPKCMAAALGVRGIARGANFEHATNSLAWVQLRTVGKLRWGVRVRTRGESLRSISSLNLRAAAASSEGNGAAGDSKEVDYDYDLVTIGGGSGGVRASRFAANHGAKVAVCELPFSTIASDTTGGVGGTCVLRGCVPKKILVYGSQFGHNFEDSKGFGWSYETEPKHDWRTLIDKKNKELHRLVGVYKNILKNNNVTLIEGRGKILDPHTVDINGKRIRARNILVAVGGRAFVPNIPGKEHVITSDEALDLPSRPAKICIVGGGYIALEFATIFSGLGTEVHVFVRQDKVLRGFDEEIREFVADQMALKGVKFHFGESPTAVEKISDGKYKLVTTKRSEEADSIMFATGRKANTRNLGLEDVGVQVDGTGAIKVDEYSRTDVPSIWAIGDVTNRVNLTPVALMEGMAFANTAFGNKPTKPDHRYIASAVFTQPPIGTVGLTEAEALDLYGDIDIYTTSFRPMKATISGLGNKTFIKIVVDASSDVVVGVHMCGDDSPEILQGFGVAVKAKLTKAQFDETVGIHPTAAEELVTMRSPTRKLRQKASQQVPAGGVVPAV
ncbi:hypothetical protein R1sor_020149 [Riccia sorocarpa]|uniref:Glutathione reductase n=1 Tax=Riccia sorocarpa TaxID=122646 RepID=A0ABD3IHA5_9MARC